MPDELSHSIQIAIGLLFGYGSIAKIYEMGAFVANLHAYLKAPATMRWIVATFIVVAEICVSVSFLTGFLLDVHAVLSLFLLTPMFFFVSTALSREDRPMCLCFGANNSVPVSYGSLTRLLVLIVGTAIVCFHEGSVGIFFNMSEAEIVDSLLIVISAYLLLVLTGLLADIVDLVFDSGQGPEVT